MGLACLLVLAAAIAFIGVAQSAIVRALCIWAVALTAYVAGLLVHALTVRLRPVGIALTGLGLALVPIAGAALGGMSLTSPKVAWVIASAVGAACYIIAAWRLKSEIVTWFAALFCLSLAMSASSLVPVAAVWYFVVLVVSTSLLALGARLFAPRSRPKFIRPLIMVGEFVAPATVAAAVFIRPAPGAGAWGALFAALAVHYAVAALCQGKLWRVAAAEGAAIIAVMCGAAGLSRLLWFPSSDDAGARAACAAVVALLSAAALGVQAITVARRQHTFGRLSLITGLIVTLLGVCLALGGLPSPMAPLSVLLGAALLLCAAAACGVALRFDLPAAQGVAIAAGMTSAAWFVAATRPAGPGADSQWSWSAGAAIGFGVVLTAGIGASVLIASRWGRRYRALRRAIPALTATASFALLSPFFFAPDLGHPIIAGIVACVILLALAGCAFAARSGLLLTGAIPVIIAIASDFAQPSPARVAVGGTIATGLLALLVASLAIAEALLGRVGRRWRALYCGIAAGIIALAAGGTVISAGWMEWFVPVFNHKEQTLPQVLLMANAVFTLLLVAARWVQLRSYAASGRRRLSLGGWALPVAVVLYGVGALLSMIGSPRGFVLAAAVILIFAVTWAARTEQLEWLLLVAFAPLAAGTISLTGYFAEDPAVRVIVAAWISWAVLYAAYWVFIGVRLRGLPVLVMAFAAAAVAIMCTPALHVSVNWLHSLPQTATGISIMIPALMLMLLALRMRERPAPRGERENGKQPRGATPATRVAANHAVPAAQWEAGQPAMPGQYPGAMPAPGTQQVYQSQLAAPWGRSGSPGLTGLQRVLPELAAWAAAFGAMIALHGIVDVRLVVGWHIVVAVAWLFGLRAEARGDSAGALIRMIISFAFLTVFGLTAALAGSGWYTLVFLVDHVALMVYGAVRSREWALWWGLVASVAAVAWFLRDLVWLALLLIALTLIGVVIWLLLRGQRHARSGQGPGPYNPRPQHPADPNATHAAGRGGFAAGPNAFPAGPPPNSRGAPEAWNLPGAPTDGPAFGPQGYGQQSPRPAPGPESR